MNFVSYWWSDKIVLKIYKAKEADKDKYKELYSMVKEIAHSAHLPMPKICIMSTLQANAFATGRNKNHAVIAITTGIIDLLNFSFLRINNTPKIENKTSTFSTSILKK